MVAGKLAAAGVFGWKRGRLGGRRGSKGDICCCLLLLLLFFFLFFLFFFFSSSLSSSWSLYSSALDIAVCSSVKNVLPVITLLWVALVLFFILISATSPNAMPQAIYNVKHVVILRFSQFCERQPRRSSTDSCKRC